MNALALTAILGFAHRFLNSRGSTLKKVNEAVLPFYILHQAVIVPVGFYVVITSWTMGIKYVVTATSSFMIIMLLYAIVRRSRVLRFIFGMAGLLPKSGAFRKVRSPEPELVN